MANEDRHTVTADGRLNVTLLTALWLTITTALLPVEIPSIWTKQRFRTNTSAPRIVEPAHQLVFAVTFAGTLTFACVLVEESYSQILTVFAGGRGDED